MDARARVERWSPPRKVRSALWRSRTIAPVAVLVAATTAAVRRPGCTAGATRQSSGSARKRWTRRGHHLEASDTGSSGEQIGARANASPSANSSAIEAALADVRQQLASLAGSGFVSKAGLDRLPVSCFLVVR